MSCDCDPLASSMDGRLPTSRRHIAAAFLIAVAGASAYGDEARTRYFEQLRQRSLFSLAESEAISRLAEANLSLTAKCDYSIELSRTLTEHAGFVSDAQRTELWQRARSTVQDLLNQDNRNPRAVLLSGQLASVFVAEGDWLRAERETRPFDEKLLNEAKAACTKAIEQLKSVEGQITEPSRDSNAKKSSPAAPSGYELRALLHQVRLQLGQTYRNRAELAAAGSAERTRDLTEADQSLRRLINVADEPIQTRAKLYLVSCARLKNDLDKAGEALATLEAMEPKPSRMLQDEIVAERARLLIDRKRPTEAAELLLKTRGQNQRLSGEQWLLQVRSLIALRELIAEKKQETLAEQINEQIATAVGRCEEQVGGYWGRRCRTVWDNVQTAQKYGTELDALMQQARSDFTAGRTDAAIAGYAAAEKLAAQKKQMELAMELGFTSASILLDGLRLEPAATEFLRLSREYPKQPRAAKSHLLGTYCLGRLYDEKKTQARREAYTEALNSHLKDYARDPTVNDARFMKAQLEEQRLQATAALPLYLEVEGSHPRALDAVAGAARCYETILRRMSERQLPIDDLQREATNRLSGCLVKAGDPDQSWTVAHAEIALRISAILLMGSIERSNTTAPSESFEKPELAGDTSYAARCHQAARWLSRVFTFIGRKDPNAPSMEIGDRLRQRAIPLQFMALVGSGKASEAEKNLGSLSTSPSELLNILDRLTQFAASTSTDQQHRLASLQQQLAERLSKQRDQLTPAETDTFDRSLMKVYIAGGQFSKAVEIGSRIAEKSAKDADVQRDIATQFGTTTNADALGLSKQCWRRLESIAKAGSPEWMTARLAVLNATVRLGQLDEARKLMQVTKVLYPDLGGPSLKPQFETVEKELQTRQK